MKVLLGAVLFLAAAAVVVYWAYRRDMTSAYQRILSGSSIAQTPCGPIEYASTGEGPPVLVVHGAGGGIDQGMDAAKDLAAAGFRVIAMSRFGYLRTPLPADASPEAQADAHACLLDALRIERTAVIGASAGAPSSMQFALRHPERCTALVLLVPAAYVPRPGGAPSLMPPPSTGFLFDTALRSDFLYWSWMRLANRVMVGAILATPPEVLEKAGAEEQARAAQMIEHTLPVSERRQGLVNDARVTLTLPRYDLERIRVPTLVIGVADDRFGIWDAARYTAEHIPGARFVGYRTGGHVWIGHHQEMLREVAAFLMERRTGSGRGGAPGGA